MLKMCFSILSILLIFLLIVNLFVFTFNDETDWGDNSFVGFDTILTEFQNCPKIDVNLPVIMEKLTITDDWGMFNWFKTFVNFISGIIALFAWITVIATNLVIAVGYFIYLLGLSGYQNIIA